ncbi:MAG TPA: MmgE/PrpD family protein [Burkholderiales bacterium]|nr:MmgE/PrpD family protein [Burkholderiales bacterium]
MDATTERLVDFALSVDAAALAPGVVHECKRRIVDTFACAAGGYTEPVSRMAQAVARLSPGGGRPASLWCGSGRVTPEAAAFANGVALRALDMSDTYGVKSIGHPSDVLSGIFAVAEAVQADGPSTLAAATLAYDVYGSFCELVDVNALGWDQPVYGVIACALGAGRLLGLTREQLGHAVALALAPNMALYQTRHGELSAWKNCAGANASRNAVFAAYLAREGVTGPAAIFEGRAGLWDAIGRHDWTVTVDERSPHRVTLTDIKLLPLCYHGLSAAFAAFDLRGRVDLERVTAVRVETYRAAIEAMANDDTRWRPETRETADHSLPYVVAAALLDGDITAESFSPQKLRDPRIAALTAKVTVHEDPAHTSRYPQAPSCRVIAAAGSGEVRAEVEYPRGHVRNPVSDAELDAKFTRCALPALGAARCAEALRALWRIDEAGDVAAVMRLFAAPDR